MSIEKKILVLSNRLRKRRKPFMMKAKVEVMMMSWKEVKIRDREIYRQDQEKNKIEH